jgi:hypothetical protein
MGRKEDYEPPNPNPFRPAKLTPATLRNDPARELVSRPVDAVDVSMHRYDDHANPATQIQEVRFDAKPVKELRPAMKLEASIAYELTPVRVTPVQMQQLRERRAEAREIGWTIRAADIRIES